MQSACECKFYVFKCKKMSEPNCGRGRLTYGRLCVSMALTCAWPKIKSQICNAEKCVMPAIYCGITIRCFTHAMVPSPYMRECFLKNTSPACNFNASFLENFMYNKDIHCNLGGPARILAPERHGGLSTATACSKLDIDAQRRAMKSCRVWIISKAT